ncbi:flagellar basal body-associated FliL family protein [Rhodobacter capsulatus]
MKLNNQFVIPVIKKGAVASLVVLSLSLEVTVGSTEKVYAAEPKLRDVLLQVLFDHANAGGFEGSFTDTANMTDLRRALTEASQSVLGGSGAERADLGHRPAGFELSPSAPWQTKRLGQTKRLATAGLPAFPVQWCR